MGMVVVVPLTFRDTIFLYVMIWASYAIPSFFNMARISAGEKSFYNLFLPDGPRPVGAFGSYVMDSSGAASCAAARSSRRRRPSFRNRTSS